MVEISCFYHKMHNRLPYLLNYDKFSPCRTPVLQAKYPDVLPDIEMQDFALLYIE